ncbi:MAG TPA: HTH domain-containing protein [Thermoplasmata archaeon]|nr:HTH domain-containing protein [Thermoplasmata archaeon]
MIEITTGTLTERIIKELQKTYPITLTVLQEKIGVSRTLLFRELEKLQTKRIIQLEPLPGKTFIRLLRNDFRFVGKKRQKKFIKKGYPKRCKKEDNRVNNEMMYA